MTEVQTKRLAYIARYRSRYEVVMDLDGRRYRIGYTGRKSKRGMVAVICNCGVDLAARLAGIDTEYRFGAGAVATLSGGWTVTFGRTEREAVLEGELQSFRDLPIVCTITSPGGTVEAEQ